MIKKPNKSQLNAIKRLPARYQIIAIVVVLVALNFSTIASFWTTYTLEHVSDGDTIIVLSNANKIRIRLYGIDAPESKQRYGDICTNKLKQLLRGKSLSLDVRDTDKYGRTVAVVYADGVDINASMVRLGCAWAYRAYSKDYVKDEEYARAHRLGLWADKNPQNPSEFRRANMVK